MKGGADLDRTQAGVRQEFLSQIVRDALRAYELARAWLTAHAGEPAGAVPPRQRAVQEAVTLLEQLLGQEVTVKEGPDGVVTAEIKEGTAPDRICSSTDPEQRHGHKRKSKKFNGHKLRISGIRKRRVKLVVAVEVLVSCQ